MVPDPSLTIRERAIAAWPRAWGGQNQRDILVSMGYDVDRNWRDLPKKERDWILFTDDQPEVPVYPGYTPAETRKALKRKEEPNYMGTFTSARRHLFHTLSKTQSALMRKQVAVHAAGGLPRSATASGRRRKHSGSLLAASTLPISDACRCGNLSLV